MTVIIIGAGVAGLHIAASLGGEPAVVLEARRTPGGRVRTAYDADGTVEYESGPWRVPSEHKRVRALFAEHGLPLIPLVTPTPPVSHPPSRVRPGLSLWDAHVLDLAGAPEHADQADLDTGYADQTCAASGSAPYKTRSRSFFVCPDGFTALAERMAARVGDVRYDHHVADVVRGGDGRYTVHVVRRTGDRTFARTTFGCDTLFVCVPPSVSREWAALRDDARSTLCAVAEGALCHIYVKHPHAAAAPFHHKTRDSTLAQTISSQYGNDWFQASYSGGRIARFWHHLRSQSVPVFWAALREALSARHGLLIPPRAEHRTHYWPRAYHTWRPAPGFSMARAVAHAVEPNPERLPGLYFAGEAFSSYQAWMEGALETAELAVQRHRRRAVPAGEGETRIDGYAVDVSRWAAAHPGGGAVLRNHSGEDLGVYMRHIGHSDEAWAFAHSMKR